MDTTLLLKIYVDGENDTPFPQGAEEPIEIGAFRYDAKRMGGAPIITASVNYPFCLDDEWTDNVYAEFNGEKYFLKQTPTSSYDNQDSMYKHDIELVSERVILDNVYFYDAVVSSEKQTEPIYAKPPQFHGWQLVGNIDINKEYTTFVVRTWSGQQLDSSDVVFDEAIRVVSGPPIDIKIESATGNIYIYDNYGYFEALGLHLTFSYIEYEKDKPVSNGTHVTFFGNIREFASRLQDSLDKCGVDYSVIVDEDVESTEEKLMSFEDQFFSNVLQEIYNTYKVPYYFVGKTIHIGFANDSIAPPTFAYGVDNALLSITKNNANFKIVNRATGTGSSDNIPYYYPNNSPKGVIAAVSSNPNVEAKVLDYELYADKVKLDGVVRKSNIKYANVKVTHTAEEEIVSGQTFSAQMGGGGIGTSFYISFDAEEAGVFLLNFSSEVFKFLQNDVEKDDATIGVSYGITLLDETDSNKIVGDTLYKDYNVKEIDNYEVPIPYAGHKYKIRVEVSYSAQGKYSGKAGQIVYDVSYSFGGASGWMYEDKVINLKDVGLEVIGNSVAGDTITQNLVKYINTSTNLMPYRYRVTQGDERFYNAENRSYADEDGEDIKFNNPFVEGKPKEHIFTVEDIKPTIKEAVNSMGLRMDMFSEFAYDLDDNDETVENEDGSQRDYVHSYFFGKLRKLDFNLFEHAIENQPMTISFTSGDCGACNFEIGVTEEFPQKNPVLVNADGTLKRDEDGNVICGQFQEVTEDEIQDIQQDTINNEVWIALKKEDSTYGILMPKAPTKEVDENGDEYEVGGHRPKACTEGQNDGDTFVILGINLPESYIINAEKKLEAEIIKYLQENNDEKFTFSINFSRIYFEENPDVLNYLNENSRINITYNGKTYLLYVTSFSYSMGEGDVLPEIRVELDEGLVVSQNALQNAINQVKSEVGRALSNIDALALAQPYFIRKDTDDEANGKINFTKGIKFGEGGKVDVLDNNSAKLTIEYLEVTKKASFTSLEVKEKTHVGGQIIISPAAMTCGEVEELDDVYRCYFQTKGADGNDEIFNQFVVNDLAICQTYNAWGSRYYWRKVVGAGEDYIDLSKTICDKESGIPMAGDKIVQLGNTEDAARQAAQVLSAYGDDAPSFIMYNGINDFTLEGKNITGVIWNPKTQEPQMYSYGSFFFGDGATDEDGNLIGDNYITYQKRKGEDNKSLAINADITIGPNSSGLTNLSEWKEKQEQIDAATQGVTLVQQDVQNLQDQIDGVVENHFYEGVPTNENFPAIQWTTDEEKANHLGDTYVNIASEEQDPDNAGKAWRWAYTDSEHTGYHWHPIADTDAVKALLESYKAQAGIDDLQYLKGTFEKSVDVDGVVMSEMVAVKNENNKIESFLNGNREFSDGGHGKIILAGGIPDGSEDLKERAKEAKTRIYEDGRIDTNNIHATGGSFENVTVSGIFKNPFDDNGMFISTSDNYVNFDSENIISITLPTDIEQSGRKVTFVGYFIITSSTDMFVEGKRTTFYEISKEITELVAVKISASEVKWHVLRRIPYGENACSTVQHSGMFAGLRPMARTLSGTVTLTPYDHTIFANDPTTNLYLPSTPVEGQEYIILVPNGGVNIRGNGKQMYLFHDAIIRSGYTCGDLATRTEQRLYWNKADDKWWVTYTKF